MNVTDYVLLLQKDERNWLWTAERAVKNKFSYLSKCLNTLFSPFPAKRVRIIIGDWGLFEAVVQINLNIIQIYCNLFRSFTYAVYKGILIKLWTMHAQHIIYRIDKHTWSVDKLRLNKLPCETLAYIYVFKKPYTNRQGKVPQDDSPVLGALPGPATIH